jgi:hypothetical protein
MSMWPLVCYREGLSEVNRAMGRKGGLRVNGIDVVAISQGANEVEALLGRFPRSALVW